MDSMLIISLFIFLVASLMGVHFTYFGHNQDMFLSEKALKKLALPKKSFLRKLLIFKEPKDKIVPFLYTQVVPFLILEFVMIGGIIAFLINQFVVSFICIDVLNLIIGLITFVKNT